MKRLLLFLWAACAFPQQPNLTRQGAERLALANNPRVKVSQLLTELQGQVAREARSGELPNVNGNLSAVEANQGSRLSSGALTASRLLGHAGMGVQVNQLITDFGRTRNLVASERLREKARQADAEATAEDIILAADQAFYQTLQAQATLEVATQTVKTRQALVDQVKALTSSKLKSELDLNFSQVYLSQARLLQVDARSNFEDAQATLTAVLGNEKAANYHLVEDAGPLPTLPPNPDEATLTALQNRPDLHALQLTTDADNKFATAQKRQILPTVSALGVVGYTPLGSTQYFIDNWYGAVGVNISVPVFNGFRFHAQAAEAEAQARIESARTRDLRNRIARDVRIAWHTAAAARQRVDVTTELLSQANSALSLAQTRYNLGLSSIVELSQAQLSQTQAAIDEANARAAYRLTYAALLFQTSANH